MHERSAGRIALHTLGCKLNYAETSTIAGGFERRGYRVVEFGSPADVIVINSCTVTESADRECRQMVRRALRANPGAFVIVTGCYAQLKPEEIASIDGVDAVLGSAEKYRMHEIVPEFTKRDVPMVRVGDIGSDVTFGPAFSVEGDSRTRAFLKVQDGCDYSCSFCTIPLARGASRSQPISDVVAQARELVARGYHEVVLTGVNVGEFGHRRGETLHDLLVALHDVEGLRRLKFSSIEPNLLEDRIIDLAASSDRLLPHFHVPLQSGSDSVLTRMRRRYRRELYAARVKSVVDRLPPAAIGVDVIVGFPGETEAEFVETAEFLLSLPVAYVHVFTYSERECTPAAGFGDAVPKETRRHRTEILRSISDRKLAAFAASQRGSVRPALIEHGEREGLMLGFTDNYVRVSLPYAASLANRIVDVRIGAFDGHCASAELVEM
jgi:threonylcarbamoyladenosine tRNA methylthiotransferase MtaB